MWPVVNDLALENDLPLRMGLWDKPQKPKTCCICLLDKAEIAGEWRPIHQPAWQWQRPEKKPGLLSLRLVSHLGPCCLAAGCINVLWRECPASL